LNLFGSGAVWPEYAKLFLFWLSDLPGVSSRREGIYG
jgi:hypothetical protein